MLKKAEEICNYLRNNPKEVEFEYENIRYIQVGAFELLLEAVEELIEEIKK